MPAYNEFREWAKPGGGIADNWYMHPVSADKIYPGRMCLSFRRYRKTAFASGVFSFFLKCFDSQNELKYKKGSFTYVINVKQRMVPGR